MVEGSATPAPRTRRGWLGRAAAAAAPALVTAALLLAGLEWLVRSQLDVYQCDPALGWTFEPDSTGIKWNRRREFFERVRFNSEGLRDLQRERIKPAGAFRVVVLGDSFTASLQVPREDTFVARLESGLAERLAAGRRVEVINAGVDGFGTAQELLLFRERMARHAPDLVLLQVFMENDLTDNSSEAGGWNHHLATRCGRPYFELAQGAVRFAGLSVPPQPGLARRWMRRSQLLFTLLPAVSADPAARPAFVNLDVFRPDAPPAVERAWRLTRELLLALRSEVRTRGARLALLVIPDKRTAGLVSEKERATLGSDVVDFRRAHRLIVGFARDHAIPLVDLLPVLAEEVRAGRTPYFASDSHLTREGHAMAARASVESLAEHCTELRLPLQDCSP